MPTILDEIIASRRERLAAEKKALPLVDLKAQLQDQEDRVRNFPAALRGPRVRVIAEIKRASPSEGVLNPLFDPRNVAQDYAGGGAAALSVLTEMDYFHGDLLHLRRARSYMALPVLRKDFIVEDYQVYQSRLARADALLLIATALPAEDLERLLTLTHSLGMAALVETHDEADLEKALNCGAKIVGINNRDLKTLQIDLAHTERLAPLVPPEVILVSESGLKSRPDIERMAAAGADAVLIGSVLMKTDLPQILLRQWITVPACPENRGRTATA